MDLKIITAEKLSVQSHDLFNNQWLLLSSGDFKENHYNAMTIAWGSLGTMWHKPFIQVVVRPTRYTFQFMERYDSFSVCAFPETYRTALSVMGKRSGRDCDKIKEAGLKPVAASLIAAPVYQDAELILECRKIYAQDFDPEAFIDPSIESSYPQKDYHRVYFGEILSIQASERYYKLSEDKNGAIS